MWIGEAHQFGLRVSDCSAKEKSDVFSLVVRALREENVEEKVE